MRDDVKKKRRAMKPSEVRQHSDAIIKQLIDASLIQGKHIGLYFSYHQEVMAECLMPWLFQHDFQVYLPVLNENAGILSFAHHTEDGELKTNYYGILEPVEPRHFCLSESLDTVLVPLVAFTTRCERVGMGKGYYDKTFAFLNHEPRPTTPKLIGLAYDFQEMPTLVQHENDVRLDVVVTETRVIRCG
jgi:5-formyltetrahydrofolate cyclo-ligase